MKITRKEFLERLIGGAVGFAGVALVVGCGGSGSTGSDSTHPDAATGPAPDGGSLSACAMNGTVSTIADNHGHVLVVSKADVAAGVAKQYDITGTADHPHTVTVTADMFARLQGDTAVTMTSTSDLDHTHAVTVMCG